jgi:hypothetical protein
MFLPGGGIPENGAARVGVVDNSGNYLLDK